MEMHAIFIVHAKSNLRNLRAEMRKIGG